MKNAENRVALVTGASSGIGKSLAVEFAEHGFDLVLVARNKAKLEHLKADCEEKYSIKAYVIECDLSKVAESSEKINLFLQENSIKIHTLVNNAGFGVHGQFAHTEIQQEVDMVNLQTSSVLALTKIVLPHMMAEKSGAILNVASVYSFTPVPFQAVYGACKSFLLSLSLSLAHELKPYRITVTALCPGTTQTEFRSRSQVGHESQKASLIIEGMTADEVAKIAFESLQKGNAVCVPGVGNKLLVALTSCLPSTFLTKAISYVNGKRGVNKSFKN